MLVDSIEGLSEDIEIYEVSEEFIQRLADAVNTQPIAHDEEDDE